MNTKRQFGIWMDGHHATVVGRDATNGTFKVLGHVNNPGADRNSNENAANNQAIALQHKFLKDTAAFLVNAEEVHITGTGQAKEQLKHYLADTPQHKHAEASESTSTKMGDEEFVGFVAKHFH